MGCDDQPSKVDRSVILIVEDDQTTRELLTLCLEDEGYLVISAREGREALEATTGMHLDLVLLDIRMAGMNGHELIRQIRGRPGPTPPIIALTASTDQTAADETIRKPFMLDELCDRVRHHLGR